MADPLVAGPGDDLVELLRRCHRAELLPLAELLEIRPDGMGLQQLAVAIDVTLRRRGAVDLVNMVRRGGDGPPYADVVRDLARRRGLALDGAIEVVERALLDQWVESAWASMSDGERDRIWRRMELELPVPADGRVALVRIKEGIIAGAEFSAKAAAVTALRVLPLLFPLLLPLAGLLGVYWMGRPKDELLLPAVLEISALRTAVRYRVTVGVVGSPSCGKDAAIKAIFGIDSGNVNPVAGSTKAVEITRLQGASALYVVNTPGMGDINEGVTEEARQVLNLIDVYVYVVNAQGGVQARELSDYRMALATGRPVLAVVNKIDTLRERDRERYLEDARDKLGARPSDFLAAAFDPLPALSDVPIGLEPVREWLADRLSDLGKDRSELPWLATP